MPVSLPSSGVSLNPGGVSLIPSTLDKPTQGVALNLGVSITGGGGSAGNSAEVQQFFDRLITLPSAPRQTLYANLINGLVADGVWAVLDMLKVYAAADSGTSLVDLKSASFLGTILTNSGNPVFTVDRGWTGTGLFARVQTGYNPTVAAGNYTLNGASAFFWSLTAASTSTQQWITDSNSNIIYFWNNADNSIDWAINTATADSFTPPDKTGLWYIERTDASNEALYRNNVSTRTKATAATTLPNAVFTSPWGPYQFAATGAGAKLTSGQRTALYTRLQTYLQAVGAV